MDQRTSQDRPLADLLEASSRGNQTAFRALYEATSAKLFGITLRIVRNRAVAEEVLQETYVKVWRNAERFTPEAGRPITWLATIARNAAIDRVRSEAFERSRVVESDDLLERLPGAEENDPATRTALRACLGELDDETQNCIVLAYCSGFSREELAERFGRPVGTIKTLLHRSMKLLRDCLERE